MLCGMFCREAPLEPLDDIEWLKANVAEEMRKREIVWDGPYPTLCDVPASGSPTGTIKMIGGRLVSLASDHSFFIDQTIDELGFWQETRNVVVDWPE